jgi:hypothetical protein
VSTTASSLSPPRGRSIQPTTSHRFSWSSIFVSSHLCLRFSQWSL